MIAALLRLLIALALALPATAQDEPLATRSREIKGVSKEEALRLTALGYTDHSPDLSNLDRSGVVHIDESLVAPGHTLVVSSAECAAHLIDLSGRELHSWRQPECLRWWSAELMRNGDLVVDGGRLTSETALRQPKGRKPIGRFAARIGWTGELVWLREIRAHHQLDWTPSQEILVLTEAQRSREDVIRRAPELVHEGDEDVKYHDNELAWLGDDGELRETLSLLEAVTTGPIEFGFLARDALLETPSHVGLFHANSAYAMDQPHLVGSHPLFQAQHVLVTSRNQNRIFVVDRQSRSLVWQWGRDELEAPHGASWLSNGHILVFDNGIERMTSRILEIDPTSGRVVWQYPNAAGIEFYSETRGLAQRLANGNTLITNSQAGEAFEVTPGGITVWQYFAPVQEPETRRPVLMSLRRYPEGWLLPEAGPASPENAAAPAIEADLIEELSAIGYLAGTEEAGDKAGVTHYDRQRAAGGMNLLTSGHAPVAILMDMNGDVVHEWRAEFVDVFRGSSKHRTSQGAPPKLLA